jgi:hypothetical protein
MIGTLLYFLVMIETLLYFLVFVRLQNSDKYKLIM